MIVEVRRIFNCSTYCISHIYVDGSYICDSIEDTDRGLDDSMTIEKIKKIKVYAKTAIPTGEYIIDMNTISPKFKQKKYYYNFCGGRMPRLQNVKGFLGILFHRGIDENSSAGCLILGYNKVKGKVVDSQRAFEAFYRRLDIANRIGERIICRITRTYKA